MKLSFGLLILSVVASAVIYFKAKNFSFLSGIRTIQGRYLKDIIKFHPSYIVFNVLISCLIAYYIYKSQKLDFVILSMACFVYFLACYYFFIQHLRFKVFELFEKFETVHFEDKNDFKIFKVDYFGFPISLKLPNSIYQQFKGISPMDRFYNKCQNLKML